VPEISFHFSMNFGYEWSSRQASYRIETSSLLCLGNLQPLPFSFHFHRQQIKNLEEENLPEISCFLEMLGVVLGRGFVNDFSEELTMIFKVAISN
jgi:hypothetical protein